MDETKPAQPDVEVPAPAEKKVLSEQITVDRTAVIQAVKIMTLAHQQGLFSKFSCDEAMRHLSVIVYLKSVSDV